MPTGTVKWFNATKGYGLITPENGSNDVFVDISAVELTGHESLRERQQRRTIDVSTARVGRLEEDTIAGWREGLGRDATATGESAE